MKLTFRRKIAPSLSAEFSRLQKGSDAERQRARNIVAAIAKVMADPLHKDFSKNLPSGYKAVDVLQQYRLFFRVVRPPEAVEQTVYFAWINDEDSRHRSGKADDCYEVFRRKLLAGDIEPYVEEASHQESFTLSEEWGAPFIYAKYTRPILASDESAHSGLMALTCLGDLEYRITYISETKPDQHLAHELLGHITRAADKRRVHLTCEIFIPGSLRLEWERTLLLAHGFQLGPSSGEGEEVWIRTSR